MKYRCESKDIYAFEVMMLIMVCLQQLQVVSTGASRDERIHQGMARVDVGCPVSDQRQQEPSANVLRLG
jgi:hypothetical protein